MFSLVNGNRGMSVLGNEFDRLFGGLAEEIAARPEAVPAMDLWEDADRVHVEMEVPGVASGDLEVSFSDGELTIRGERRTPQREGASWHWQGRAQGGFARSIRIPVEVDADRIEAGLKDGVLTVTLHKAEAVKPRKITVRES